LEVLCRNGHEVPLFPVRTTTSIQRFSHEVFLFFVAGTTAKEIAGRFYQRGIFIGTEVGGHAAIDLA
jgi:hypothetical protein